MVICWSHNSRDRPSASQIVSIASSPEFTITRDIVQLNVTNVVAALGVQYGGKLSVKGLAFMTALMKNLSVVYNFVTVSL